MNKNQFLELYAKYCWPIARNFISKKMRCRQCLLSEMHGPLLKGVCGECSKYQSKKTSHARDEINKQSFAEDFDALIKSHTGNKKYDAALMLSGGKDSAYVLQRLSAEYPDFKVLSIIVNNGFMSPLAISGAKATAERFRSDLIVVNSHIDAFYQALRKAFLELKGRGCYGVVDYTDGSMIFQVGTTITQQLNIPLLIGGLSWTQVQMIVGIHSFTLQKENLPLQVFPLAVWQPSENEIRETVRSLDLLPKGYDSPIQSNSELITVMSVIDVMNLGYCSFEPEFAQMIREGKADRKTWLYLFEMLEFGTRKNIFKNDLRRILGKLELSVSDIVKS
ncbi:MAG: hypothetical protein RIS44_2338 [Pseudomonadota bacterium]